MKPTGKADPYSLDEGTGVNSPPSAPPSAGPKPGLDLEAPIEAEEVRKAIDPAKPLAPPKPGLDLEPRSPAPSSPAAGSPSEGPSEGAGRFTDTMQAGVHVISFSRADVLDAEYIQNVGDDIYRHLKLHPQPKVIIDLDTVQFLSSSALGMLIALRTVVVDKMDGKICIANVHDDLKQVFKITKLHKLMEIHDDTDKAIKSLL